MSSLTQVKSDLETQIAAVRTKALAAVPADIMYSALGGYVCYGCKVTGSTASPLDNVVHLSGQASGDSAMLNPDLSLTPTRGFQYPNIASLADGAFRSLDTTATVPAAPATSTARYDIAYIFVGPGGAGFAIATGTPSAAVKTDYDSNGLDTADYGSAAITDPDLPVGALPVARIYVEDVFHGISAAQIADIRPTTAGVNFSGISAIKDAAEDARDAAQEWASNAEDVPVSVSGSPQDFSAKHYSAKASASSTQAQAWAETAEDTPVPGSGSPQGFSAKHHAAKASASASAASSSAGTAGSAESGAVAAANAAAEWASNAEDVPVSVSGSPQDFSAKHYAAKAAASAASVDDAITTMSLLQWLGV